MKKQAGFSIAELLVVVAIIGIIAAIAIPSLIRAEISERQESFRQYFDVILPVKDRKTPLTQEQKQIVAPLVAARLRALCVLPSEQPVVGSPSTDPNMVQNQLNTLRDLTVSEEEKGKRCRDAKAAAGREGFNTDVVFE